MIQSDGWLFGDLVDEAVLRFMAAELLELAPLPIAFEPDAGWVESDFGSLVDKLFLSSMVVNVIGGVVVSLRTGTTTAVVIVLRALCLGNPEGVWWWEDTVAGLSGAVVDTEETEDKGELLRSSCFCLKNNLF